MVNNIKAFWRYPAIGMGFVFAFVIVCLGGTAVLGPESLFANYIRGGGIMLLIMNTVLATSLVRSMVNIALAMGAVRKSLWGAIELVLVLQALVCLPMQALLDWGTTLAPDDSLFVLTLPVQGGSIFAWFLLLWAMGTLGAWLALVQKTGWKIFGWVMVGVLYVGYLAVMVAQTIFSFFDMGTVLWGIFGAGLVVGAAASFALYRLCRTAQVTLL